MVLELDDGVIAEKRRVKGSRRKKKEKVDTIVD